MNAYGEKKFGSWSQAARTVSDITFPNKSGGQQYAILLSSKTVESPFPLRGLTISSC